MNLWNEVQEGSFIQPSFSKATSGMAEYKSLVWGTNFSASAFGFLGRTVSNMSTLSPLFWSCFCYFFSIRGWKRNQVFVPRVWDTGLGWILACGLRPSWPSWSCCSSYTRAFLSGHSPGKASIISCLLSLLISHPLVLPSSLHNAHIMAKLGLNSFRIFQHSMWSGKTLISPVDQVWSGSGLLSNPFAQPVLSSCPLPWPNPWLASCLLLLWPCTHPHYILC